MSESRYAVPPGFRPLLEALAREVLRSQPGDIYEYSYNFFEKIMRFKKEHGVYPMEDPKNYAEFKKTLNIQASPTPIQNGATTAAQPDTDPELVTAATKLQSNFRGSKTRKELQEQEPEQTQQVAPEQVTPAVAQDDADVEKAATKIQAAFRGFQVRLKPEQFGINKSRRKSAEHASIPRDLDLSQGRTVRASSLGGQIYSPKEEHAATKIQAGIRGFLTRKEVKKKVEHEKTAATKIQSRFSAATPRSRLKLAFDASIKFVNAGLERAKLKTKSTDDDVNNEEEKGYQTRKQLDEQGLLSPSRSSTSSKAEMHDGDEADEQQAATKIQLEIATGSHPYSKWKTPFEQLKQVVTEEPPKLPRTTIFGHEFSPECHDFIAECLRKDYHSRPKYTQLQNHAWYNVGKETTDADVAAFVEQIMPKIVADQFTVDVLERLRLEDDGNNDEMGESTSEIE